MNFGHPKLLWTAAAILPLLAIFLWATWRKRQALIRSFVQNKQLAELTLGTSTSFQKLRRVLLFFAVAALLFAVARPQWGFAWEEATQRGRDIIVAIDTSRSMLAEDLQPNRLTRAKLAALDLLKLGKFDRFGLVAFSGSAFLQCPLTFDDEAFRQSVQILEPGIIPQGGTALSEAIDSARRAFSEDADDNHRVLVLFTDGEDHEEGVLNTVDLAAADGMKIFTVGVGTSGGELLRIQDESGKLVFLKDSAGNVVKSRLNEQLLQQIAAQSGGFYLPLQGANAMELLYNKGLAPLPTSERSTKLMKRLKEQFYWPLILAVLLLLLEIFLPQQKRTVKVKSPNVQGLAGSRAMACLVLMLSMHCSFADAKKAMRLYNSEQYKSALAEYQRLIEESPNNTYLRFNAGASAYQLNEFELAAEAFAGAARSRDLDLQQKSFYNLGNTHYSLGNRENTGREERIDQWELAVRHYEAALKLNPHDLDAKTNLELVRRKLEELKNEQEQQKKDGEKKDEEQENSENKDEQQKQDNQEEQKDDKSEQDQKSNEQKDESNKSPQEEQKQQSENQEQEKKEGTPNDSQPQQEGDKQTDDQQKPDAEGQAEAAQLGKMTPAQAKQLLDAQKDEEKALIFIPQKRESGAQNRTFKDW